jgi:hypothetical protein
MDVKEIVLSKELIVVAANKSLFFFTQEVFHSNVVSLTNFENPYRLIVDLCDHKPKK